MMEPAATVIRICGGVEAVAEMAERHVTRVHRWTYPRERGGTGGKIPMDAAEKLLAAARERGIDLAPEHFFALPEAGAAPQREEAS